MTPPLLLDYVRVPMLSMRKTVMLGHGLVDNTPQVDSPVIAAARTELLLQLDLGEQALTARLREAGPGFVAEENQFDRATDALWIALRKALEVAEAYGHPGLDQLSDKAKQEADLDGLREKAAVAVELYARLFAGEGTNFVLLPFDEQVGAMATILRLVEEDGLDEQLEAVVGPELPRMLKLCQAHYEAMVSDRHSRAKGSKLNLLEQRSKLRWAIFAYNNAVMTLIKPSEPESLALVEAALRPMISVRLSARGGAGELEGEAEPALEGEVEAPDAESL